MFCRRVIGALQCGQVERGTTRLKGAAVTPGSGGRAGVGMGELRTLRAPLALEHDRQAVDDDVQEAADQQAEDEHTRR